MWLVLQWIIIRITRKYFIWYITGLRNSLDLRNLFIILKFYGNNKLIVLIDRLNLIR